jgi:hypothetical protein
MTSVVRFFNHNARLQDVFTDLPSTPRSWVLNGYGRCEISVPLDHPAAKESFLRFGNIIHIQHVPDPTDTGGKLPDWCGIILPPRTWNKDSIQLVAYSLEGIFAYRAMPFIDKLTGTAASVFLEIIRYSQASYPGGNAPFMFAMGTVDVGPLDTYSDDLRTNAYDHIKKLVSTANMEWSAEGKLSNNDLLLSVSLQNRKTSASGLSLTPDNTEESNPLLIEQGVPFNQIFAYSQAQTAADRIMQEIDNLPSINLFGPFQVNQTYMGVHDAAGLLATAQAASDLRGYPQRVFKRVALNVADTFNFLRTGNLVQVEDSRAGFNADGSLGFKDFVRIISMDYNDTTDKVNLNVEIVPTRLTERTALSIAPTSLSGGD